VHSEAARVRISGDYGAGAAAKNCAPSRPKRRCPLRWVSVAGVTCPESKRTVSLPLLASDPLVDINVLVQDLIEVCRSPEAAVEPEIGRATLAFSHVTMALSRVAQTRVGREESRAVIEQAMRSAREAVERARRARHAGDRARVTQDRAVAAVERARLRGRPPSTDLPPMLRAWTTTRDVPVACPACRRRAVVHYKYRFVEGLAARTLPCPRADCAGALTFHFPATSFEIGVRAVE